MTQQKPTLSTEEVQTIAIAYAQECRAKGHRPTMADMAERLGYHRRWLTTNLTPRNLRVRAIILKTWIEMDAPPCAKPFDNDIWTDELDDIPDPPMPENPIAGAALYQVLIDPDRLKQFCNLAESWGIGAALRYAEQTWNRAHAKSTPKASP
jgi:hypothetical protein